MRSRSIAAAALVVLFAAAAFAPAPARAGGRAFTIEDIYRIKGVADPQVSPDGRTIAYVVTTSDLAEVKRTSRIWLVDADGSNRRPLTSGEKRDSSPRWSPDGKSIAFVSDRSGSSQLWIIPTEGGEAYQLTTLSTGASDPVWSGDGKLVAFTSQVYPEIGDDDAAQKKLDEQREKGKLKARVADALLYRHWDSWTEGKRNHVFVAEIVPGKPGKVRDVTPGDFDSPPFQLAGPLHYAFSPDGAELCFTSHRAGNAARSTNSDLYVVPTAGGPAKAITANEGFDGNPLYSPDGKLIAFRTQSIDGYEADRFRLAIYDRAIGEIRSVSDAHDGWVDSFEWFPDSRRVAFTSDWKGDVPLFVLDVADKSVRLAANLGTIDSFKLANDATWAAVARRTVGSPAEIHRVALHNGEGRRLTFENEAIEKEVDIRPAERIEVAGADGKPVQVFIVKPHDFDETKKYPLILNIHGGPQSQWADAFRGDWQVYPGKGYVVAFPNPHGSTGFGQEYTAAISKDWNGKVMEDIDKVAARLSTLPYVDADRMGAMGWSWGGYAMMWLEGGNERFKCLAAMMGVYDLPSMYGATEELWFPTWDLGGEPWNSKLYETQSPSRRVPNFKTPCLVVTGEKDYRVPYTQSLQFFTHLQVMGVPSRLVVFENAGHWPAWYEMALYYNAHLEWFEKWLGGEKAPWDTIDMSRNGGPWKKVGAEAEKPEKKGASKTTP